MKKAEIKQIIVVTDGKSNIGGNPVEAAVRAAREGITVNVIGIMAPQEMDDRFLQEVEEIAQAGKGVSEITMIQDLGHTMHMVTQKSMNKTIETIVGKQLKEILGNELEEIPPQSRNKIIEYMDQLGENVGLKCCIVMDCSGSMGQKIGTARQSIIELMNSLKGRVGKSEIAVIAYPGESGEHCKIINPFTADLDQIKRSVLSLKAGGTTPTAPAIGKALELMQGETGEGFTDNEWNQTPLLKESMV